MTHIRIMFGLMLFAGVLGTTAMAQSVQRTFVSGLGNDGNPCSRTAPCRTFGQAISQTNRGGEVVVLDSAGYGPVTITQSVSITAPPGVYAGISVFSGTGITISTSSGDTVILRGLTINNQGSSGDGISFANRGALRIENCVVNGFSNSGGLGGEGLVFSPAGPDVLLVKDSIFRGNFIGIDVLGGSAVIEQVMLEGIVEVFDQTPTSLGLKVGGGAQCTIRNSVAANCLTGFQAFSANSSDADLEIENCTASHNREGVGSRSTSTGTATILVSNSTITHNPFGLSNDGPNSSSILSRGNNTVERNVNNTFGTIGSYSPK